MNFICKYFICGIALSISINGFAAEAALGTKENIGKAAGAVDVEVLVQSPAAQKTPLQIVCAFEYKEGDLTKSPPALPKDLNGLLHVDEALNGLITDLRKSNQFKGQLLETLLITPPSNTIPAEKLLIIGLGNRNDFKPEIMKLVGLTGMREALRLGVSSYSHASDLKDAGIDSPTAEVAGYVISGASEAFQTQNFLYKQNASSSLTIKKVIVLCGPAYFDDTKTGIKKVIAP
ncbi:M17 family peptidase N-terminal domain-containing protein [Candidatus Protochlamydia phocaeensis]|uniref:M17 family peptidase N-terminal domain-containing protein n=1 Tax=Candidatus Protochlamydia phocaeensis TaxID=1414722 RepID=UPI000838E20B|nr:M17 family peptidase N-terminal domain-containing protein [Candidatus Protochlamydia phocaeensis]